MKPHLKQQWCLPDGVNALFVARMEEVLDLYAAPPDPQRPVICFDEKGKELVAQKRPDESMQPGQIQREDYEYSHEGACNLTLVFAPAVGWRHVAVTARRQAQDCARLLRWLVDEQFPTATLIRLVCDNLNIHHPRCLYQTFPPAEARRIAQKLEWHYTPKHASWLNMAEIELSVLTRQCLERRMASQALVAQEVTAWETERNQQQIMVRWQFTCEVARVRMEKYYPTLAGANMPAESVT